MKKTIQMACLGIGLLTIGSSLPCIAVGPTCLRNCADYCRASRNPQKCFHRFCHICYDQKEMTPKSD